MEIASVIITAYNRCDTAKWNLASLEDHSFSCFGNEAGVSMRIAEENGIRVKTNKGDYYKLTHRIKSLKRLPT